MIRPTKTGWNARYRPSPETHPIVGWSEQDGSPLIVHPLKGTLVAAASFTTAEGHAFSGVTNDDGIHLQSHHRRDIENFDRAAQLFSAWRNNDAEALAAICTQAEAEGVSVIDLASGLLHLCDCLIFDCESRHPQEPSASAHGEVASLAVQLARESTPATN